MPLNITNIELSDSFNTWRLRTNSIINRALQGTGTALSTANTQFNGIVTTNGALNVNNTVRFLTNSSINGEVTVNVRPRLVFSNTITFNSAITANTLSTTSLTVIGGISLGSLTATGTVSGNTISGTTVAATTVNATTVNATTVSGTSLTGTSVTASGTVTGSTFSGSGASLTNLNAGNISTGTLPVARGGTGITSLGTGVATALGQTVTGSGGIVLSTSPTFTTPALGTPSSGNLLNCTADGTNTVGFKKIPASGAEKTSSYTLTTSDVGKLVIVGSGGSIVVPNNTFSSGDAVVIFNNTSGGIILTMSITTSFIGGVNADDDSITLLTRGICSVLFISGTVCVVSGNII